MASFPHWGVVHLVGGMYGIVFLGVVVLANRREAGLIERKVKDKRVCLCVPVCEHVGGELCFVS